MIVWDAMSSKEIRRISAHRDYINAVAFSPDGSHLVSAGRDGAIKLWNADDGKLVRLLRARQGEVLALAFHPNGKLLASGGADGSVKVWDASSKAK